MTGINEKGLMVCQWWLDETRYPPADSRPAIGILEWIQYNLDRHASVAEVLADAEGVRPMSRVTIHYLVADATGDSAAIEFLDGKLVVHRGAAMPVRALANSTYADSVAAFERARSKGEVPTSVSSLDRFVRAAMLADEANADPIARGFEILASVAQPYFTRWSVVYDLSAREVYFRTEGNQAIRRVALAGLDFSCGTPVKMLDVTAGGVGEVHPHDRGCRDQPLAEHSIAKVVGGFLRSGEAILHGSGRSPQTRELREHVPDPVTGLPTGL